MAVPKNSLCQLILPMPKHPGGMVFHSNAMPVTQMMANVGTYNMGMTIVGSGTNNQQVFCFNTDKNLFGSEEVARTLGSLFLEELQDLAREMV
ncbi:unnamed protein product [Allacma fusca]|uniref:O-acyltransferase WSD1 C-terminal domain-containing protein n=1 Tax=Allacma fusca TaxID=39272 RepID=A0A8J2JZ60_9HEXA|nr:unnamed protein product [Allacma fusca]